MERKIAPIFFKGERMKMVRLAASGIVLSIDGASVLLARYRQRDGNSFLVGPGGGVEGEESLQAALQREVFEEARLQVEPYKLLFIEDLLNPKYRMLKFWFLCHVTGGMLIETPEALDEGIVSVAWYTREQLETEVVYPVQLKQIPWDTFFSDSWQTRYLEPVVADF